jgi:hypothetical protein
MFTLGELLNPIDRRSDQIGSDSGVDYSFEPFPSRTGTITVDETEEFLDSW